jgi:hypothetical protein
MYNANGEKIVWKKSGFSSAIFFFFPKMFIQSSKRESEKVFFSQNLVIYLKWSEMFIFFFLAKNFVASTVPGTSEAA